MNTEELIIKYIPLANKIAFTKKKTLPRHVDVEELQSAAYMGLCEAANRFDEARGVTFSTFAYPRIVGAIVDYLREQSWGKRNDPKTAFSLDVSLAEDGIPLKDMIVSKLDANTEEMLEVVSRDLDGYAENVMRCYFIDECSMKEVGERFGVSESRICQLITKYKSRIKEKWSEKDLRVELAA